MLASDDKQERAYENTWIRVDRVEVMIQGDISGLKKDISVLQVTSDVLSEIGRHGSDTTNLEQGGSK